MRKTTAVLAILFSSIGLAFGQSDNIKSDIPVVGQACPDFILERVSNYSLKSASLSDFKGKWLFLDFWFRSCVSCIKSMPKINELDSQFHNDAVFLMVGMNSKSSTTSGIEEMYENLRKKQNLKMAYAFDSILIREWNIRSMPHIVIVSPDGIVKAITDGRDMTKEKVAALINGDKVSFYEKLMVQPEFNSAEYSLIGDDDEIIYQSILSNWNGQKQVVNNVKTFIQLARQGKKNTYEAIMIPLYGLYNLAYIGNFNWSMDDTLYKSFYYKPVLEINDSSLFQFDYRVEVGKGTYNYSLTMPLVWVTDSSIMQTLQQDLKKSFGYTVSVENRKVPVWRLILISPKLKNKIKSKGGNVEASGNWAGGMKYRNYPMESFLNQITYYISDNQLPFIDFTELDSNIDFTTKEDLTTFEGVRRGLRENGLDFVIGEKEMKVVVIKDPR